ncbi:hypothetical protein C8F01DRAFT_1158416 [Mycena amicta]|nr:hypothetical protein C8F01DRAFT_1158416 [Mycena amicta]
MSRLAAVFLLSSVLLTSNLVAAAPTPDLVTIKFPAADSAPISAKVLGDDGQGHTTYEVEAVVTMGGTTIPSFTATGTPCLTSCLPVLSVF